MTFDEGQLERATIAAYEKCREQAPTWQLPEELWKYVPWADLTEEFQERWRAYIRAALGAA
jgi:hypothetical protein